MSVAQAREPLRLPASLQTQLYAFRRRVWTIKLAEVAALAVVAVMVAFLCVFALDRLWDTPRWLRLGIFAAAICGCAIVPFHLHRWVWRRRRLEQLARLLTSKLPRLGDQLLGIIELVHSDGEQARSRALCEVGGPHRRQRRSEMQPRRRDAEFAASRLGNRCRGSGGGDCSPRRGGSHRDRQRLGAVSRSLGPNASLHVRRRESAALGNRRCPRRAFRDRRGIGGRFALASPRGPRHTRCAVIRKRVPGAVATGRRPLPIPVAGPNHRWPVVPEHRRL